MNFRHAWVLGVGLGLASLGTAQAQNMSAGADGIYMRLEGGWNHQDDSSTTGPGGGTSSTHYEGYIVGGALGYKWGPWRLEGQVDYRDNDLKSLSGPGVAGLSGGVTGSTTSMTGLINGYYDLPWMPLPNLIPYVGVGVGATSINLNGIAIGQTHVAGDKDLVFAVQPSLGVRYVLGPSAWLGLEYRFLNGFNPTFTNVKGASVNHSDYQNNSILVSFTYSFGAPPPPPAQAVAAQQEAAAPAATRRVFLVFFDFDKSTITAAGRQVVAAAAAAYKGGNGAKIQAAGYTDLAGTAAYNMALSERRADSVRDLLVADGVPASAVDLSWHGKQDPRVPTPDGVREPQNRRVEVDLP